MVGLPERLLMRVDKATMLYGIEAREPFLDPAVLEIALRIPPVLRAESPKSVLKAIAGEMLPIEILNRRKVGFPTLHRVFLAPKVLTLIREKVIHKKFLDLTGLDRHQLELFFIDAEKGGTRFFYQIWSIFILSLWFHNWVEAKQ
jgi:asparagine synthase (glutamine-hydrolysing)